MMVLYHQGLYFGLPQMLENDQTGEVEVQLITSRDGIRWEHPFPEQPFIPRGPASDFDDMITWFPQAVAQGDSIFLLRRCQVPAQRSQLEANPFSTENEQDQNS